VSKKVLGKGLAATNCTLTILTFTIGAKPTLMWLEEKAFVLAGALLRDFSLSMKSLLLQMLSDSFGLN
jgi:hypothetical protein